MRTRANRGVTLMELLIAVSLVGLLSVGILMALRVGVNAMEKTNDRLLSNRKVLGSQRILEQQIAGIIPTTAICGIGGGGGGSRQTFFQGEPQSMRFVSAYSLQEGWRGYPRILEYQVIPGADGQGVRLVVNERVYAGPESAGTLCLGGGPQGVQFRPIETGPGSFVLADRLAYCRFEFQEVMPNTQEVRWVPLWTTNQFPSAIRIDVAPLEPDPSKLPLLTMTAPLRVNKNPLFPYVDAFLQQ